VPPRWEEERRTLSPFPFCLSGGGLPFCEGSVVSHELLKRANRRPVSRHIESGYDFVGLGLAFFEGLVLGFADGLALALGEIDGDGFGFGGGAFEITILSM
jgi:hypothetical protein